MTDERNASVNADSTIETPVPYGGEMTVPEDDPWEFPQISEDRLAAIGVFLVEKSNDPRYIADLRAEIAAPLRAHAGEGVDQATT